MVIGHNDCGVAQKDTPPFGWRIFLVPRRGEKRHPILRERSEQAKSRQNSPVDCFAVERRIPDGAPAGGLLRQRESKPLGSAASMAAEQTFCPRCANRPADTFVSAKRVAALKAACCIRRRRRFAAFPVVSADARTHSGPTIDTSLRTLAATAAVPAKYILTDELYY